MNQSRQTKHYLKQIKRLSPSDYSGRKQILQTIRQSLDDYQREHPDATIDDFEAEFGTPEEVADSLLDELSGSIRERNIRHKNIWLIILGCTLIILSVSILWFSWFLIQGTAVETTETITIYENGPAPWEE